MRSSRSGTDPLDPGPAGFAHRGLHDGSALLENSLAAFSAALELGAGIECDLRITADGKVVVFHDPDATRMCSSPLVIGRSTLDELQSLRLGGEPIPRLQSLLDMVGGKVPLLLEVKVDRDCGRWLPALLPILARYSGPVGLMSFDPRIARFARGKLNSVSRGLVVRDGLPAWKRQAALAIADPEFLAIERTALAKPWVGNARLRMPVYSWTIRTREERLQAAVHADALIWERDGRP